MAKQYYFFYLEMSLRDKDDLNIYAQVNISHIPSAKLVEIFNIDIKKDPQLSAGYFLTKNSYRKHKRYIHEHIGHINLDLFEYALMLFGSTNRKSIRNLYKEDPME